MQGDLPIIMKIQKHNMNSFTLQQNVDFLTRTLNSITHHYTVVPRQAHHDHSIVAYLKPAGGADVKPPEVAQLSAPIKPSKHIQHLWWGQQEHTVSSSQQSGPRGFFCKLQLLDPRTHPKVLPKAPPQGPTPRSCPRPCPPRPQPLPFFVSMHMEWPPRMPGQVPVMSAGSLGKGADPLISSPSRVDPPC